ncbi:hypothetical protein Celaphus_00001489 [Cervus elaphus hippelaphus]|uniref:Uncharacterized protein n=1 Tax=Cervus elaphus hippelaphus TaxID=46360 RepID=A0A212D940_CEREH|nr:hypothetical protein Celaphus_00001489 [Cervus elaphus hippelaphus]
MYAWDSGNPASQLRTLGKPRKNVSPNAPERAKPTWHRQSTERMLGQAAQRDQDWYAGPTSASSSCGSHPHSGSTRNWSTWCHRE